jgi:hypothetical protein
MPLSKRKIIDNMLRDPIFQAARGGMPLVAPEGPAVPPGKNNQSAGFAVFIYFIYVILPLFLLFIFLLSVFHISS